MSTGGGEEAKKRVQAKKFDGQVDVWTNRDPFIFTFFISCIVIGREGRSMIVGEGGSMIVGEGGSMIVGESGEDH